jgi:hypothetical protein
MVRSNPDRLAWLLDEADPGPRYLTMRDLLDYPPDDPELLVARRAAHQNGPIAAILDAMHPDGYWVEPSPGYYPKYTGTIWSLIALAQLGASAAEDRRIGRAVIYTLAHALTPGGQVSMNGLPSGTADCLQGNLLAALLDLGVEPARLETAFDWMARSVTGKGVAPMTEKKAAQRYYAGKCGPLFACGANNKLSCAWGGVKVMLAFGKLPEMDRTPEVEEAIQAGVDFFLSVDPATADYPNGWAEKPSGNWWKFGFPVYYVTDLLQLAEALCLLGYAQDRRLKATIQLIHEQQDARGRWALNYDYNGKGWVDFGVKKQPNKYVTLRAMRVMKFAR